MPQAPGDTMLDQELAFYDAHLPEWLTQFPGKFVAIKGDELLGVFDTQEQALAEAGRRFGLSSYLIRRVEPQQPAVHIPALTLGLLHADSQRPAHSTGANT